MKRPRYGEEGERARFCAAHKFDNMVDLATRRGSSKCNSPTKRSRDGPRTFAHDSAEAASSGPGHRSVPSFNLGIGSGTPAPKRGHTPAHAGGHRVSVPTFIILTFKFFVFVAWRTAERWHGSGPAGGCLAIISKRNAKTARTVTAVWTARFLLLFIRVGLGCLLLAPATFAVNVSRDCPSPPSTPPPPPLKPTRNHNAARYLGELD